MWNTCAPITLINTIYRYITPCYIYYLYTWCNWFLSCPNMCGSYNLTQPNGTSAASETVTTPLGLLQEIPKAHLALQSGPCQPQGRPRPFGWSPGAKWENHGEKWGVFFMFFLYAVPHGYDGIFDEKSGCVWLTDLDDTKPYSPYPAHSRGTKTSQLAPTKHQNK